MPNKYESNESLSNDSPRQTTGVSYSPYYQWKYQPNKKSTLGVDYDFGNNYLSDNEWRWRTIPSYLLDSYIQRGASSSEQQKPKTEVEQNAEKYAQRYKDMGLDRADALGNLRYAPIVGGLFEMLNKDNLVDAEPYRRLAYDTLDRARMHADAPMGPVGYNRYSTEAEAARQQALAAQANRAIAAAYANRPGSYAAAASNLFAKANEQAGLSYLNAAKYNQQIAQAEDAENRARMAEYLQRRAAANQVNSGLEYNTGSAVNDILMAADQTNRATKFGNRQNFYKNLMNLGQDSYNKWMAGVSALNGTESAGYNSPYERP